MGEIMIQCANSLDPEETPIIGVSSGSKLFDTLIEFLSVPSVSIEEQNTSEERLPFNSGRLSRIGMVPDEEIVEVQSDDEDNQVTTLKLSLATTATTTDDTKSEAADERYVSDKLNGGEADDISISLNVRSDDTEIENAQNSSANENGSGQSQEAGVYAEFNSSSNSINKDGVPGGSKTGSPVIFISRADETTGDIIDIRAVVNIPAAQSLPQPAVGKARYVNPGDGTISPTISPPVAKQISDDDDDEENSLTASGDDADKTYDSEQTGDYDSDSFLEHALSDDEELANARAASRVSSLQSGPQSEGDDYTYFEESCGDTDNDSVPRQSVDAANHDDDDRSIEIPFSPKRSGSPVTPVPSPVQDYLDDFETLSPSDFPTYEGFLLESIDEMKTEVPYTNPSERILLSDDQEELKTTSSHTKSSERSKEEHQDLCVQTTPDHRECDGSETEPHSDRHSSCKDSSPRSDADPDSIRSRSTISKTSVASSRSSVSRSSPYNSRSSFDSLTSGVKKIPSTASNRSKSSTSLRASRQRSLTSSSATSGTSHSTRRRVYSPTSASVSARSASSVSASRSSSSPSSRTSNSSPGKHVARSPRSPHRATVTSGHGRDKSSRTTSKCGDSKSPKIAPAFKPSAKITDVKLPDVHADSSMSNISMDSRTSLPRNTNRHRTPRKPPHRYKPYLPDGTKTEANEDKPSNVSGASSATADMRKDAMTARNSDHVEGREPASGKSASANKKHQRKSQILSRASVESKDVVPCDDNIESRQPADKVLNFQSPNPSSRSSSCQSMSQTLFEETRRIHDSRQHRHRRRIEHEHKHQHSSVDSRNRQLHDPTTIEDRTSDTDTARDNKLSGKTKSGTSSQTRQEIVVNKYDNASLQDKSAFDLSHHSEEHLGVTARNLLEEMLKDAKSNGGCPQSDVRQRSTGGAEDCEETLRTVKKRLQEIVSPEQERSTLLAHSQEVGDSSGDDENNSHGINGRLTPNHGLAEESNNTNDDNAHAPNNSDQCAIVSAEDDTGSKRNDSIRHGPGDCIDKGNENTHSDLSEELQPGVNEHPINIKRRKENGNTIVSDDKIGPPITTSETVVEIKPCRGLQKRISYRDIHTHAQRDMPVKMNKSSVGKIQTRSSHDRLVKRANSGQTVITEDNRSALRDDARRRLGILGGSVSLSESSDDVGTTRLPTAPVDKRSRQRLNREGKSPTGSSLVDKDGNVADLKTSRIRLRSIRKELKLSNDDLSHLVVDLQNGFGHGYTFGGSSSREFSTNNRRVLSASEAFARRIVDGILDDVISYVSHLQNHVANTNIHRCLAKDVTGREVLCCLLQSPSHDLDGGSVACDIVNPLDLMPVTKHYETLLTHVLQISSMDDTQITPEKEVLMVIPINTTAMTSWQEPIVRELGGDGKWRDIDGFCQVYHRRIDKQLVPTVEIILKGVQTIAVVARPRRDHVVISDDAVMIYSSVDERVIMAVPASPTHDPPKQVSLQVIPVDVKVINCYNEHSRSEEESRPVLLASSPLILLEMTDRTPETFHFTVPCTPTSQRSDSHLKAITYCLNFQTPGAIGGNQLRPLTGESRGSASTGPSSATTRGSLSPNPAGSPTITSRSSRSASSDRQETDRHLVQLSDGPGMRVKLLNNRDGYPANNNNSNNNDDRAGDDGENEVLSFSIHDESTSFIAMETKTDLKYSEIECLAKSFADYVAQQVVIVTMYQTLANVHVVHFHVDIKKDMRSKTPSAYTAGYYRCVEQEMLFEEGDTISLRLKGNVKMAGEQVKVFAFHGFSGIHTKFQVEVINHFCQRSLPAFHGLLQVSVLLPQRSSARQDAGFPAETADGWDTCLEMPVSVPKLRPQQTHPKLIKAPVYVQLEPPLTEDFIRTLSLELVKDWDTFAQALDLGHARIQSIKQQNRNLISDKIVRDLLLCWMKRLPRAYDKVKPLVSVLRRCKKWKLANDLCDRHKELASHRQREARDLKLKNAIDRACMSPRVNSKWRHIFRHLLSNTTADVEEKIRQLEKQYPDEEMRCYSALYHWKDNTKNPSVFKLVDVLRLWKCHVVADSLTDSNGG